MNHPKNFRFLRLLTAALILLLFNAGSEMISAGEPLSLSDIRTRLSAMSIVQIRAARRTMNDGTAAFPPQVGIGYEAFWLRDYAYTLEGSPEAYSPKELLDSARVFLNGISPDGACVDCVKFDGTPIYKPGYGTMGENPVVDGPAFTVAVVYLSWRYLTKIGDAGSAALLSDETLDRLDKAMQTVPRDPANGLVFIDPNKEWDRCGYGFTDAVRKSGDVFFASLLDYEAAGRMAELCDAANRADAAERYRRSAQKTKAAINDVFWDDAVGLYRAATVRCREHDVWGSAFAVALGAADEARSQRIGGVLKANYSGIVQKGQIRQLLPGVYWESAGGERDQYQNGGFWGTASGWVLVALSRVDRELALSTANDLYNDYQDRGLCDWIFGEHVMRPGYLSSVSMPVAGLDMLLKRP